MKNIYTIGFTKKSAQEFFESLKNNGVEFVVDIRLNNTSQLAAFAKYPDIEYFLKVICNIKYIHDELFAPTDIIMKNFRNKKIAWPQFKKEFCEILTQRNIVEHIREKYSLNDNICLLCSEALPEGCHRMIIAEQFAEIFKDSCIYHL